MNYHLFPSYFGVSYHETHKRSCGFHLPVGVAAPISFVEKIFHVSREALNWFCERHGFVGWFETSAKQNINIDEASRFLVKKVLDRLPASGTPSGRLGMKVRHAERRRSSGLHRKVACSESGRAKRKCEPQVESFLYSPNPRGGKAHTKYFVFRTEGVHISIRTSRQGRPNPAFSRY